MEKIRLIAAGLGLAATITMGAACSSESLAEFGLEKVLAAETGEDIDLDLDFDDGSFRVEGPDGEFVINTDGLDSGAGTFSITGDGETVSGSFGEAGFVMQGADGEVIEGTYGEGGFEVNSSDGSFSTVVNDDGSGTTTITDSDGQATTFDFDQSRPDGWPGYIGEPATVIADDTIYTTSADGMHAVFSYQPGEAYLQTLVENLARQGFETVTEMDFEGTITMVMVDRSSGVGVQMLGNDGEGFASITIGSADQF